MSIDQFINDLRSKHEIVLSVVGGELKVKVPKNNLNDELINHIKSKKSEIISFVEENKRLGTSIGKAPHREFFPLSSAQRRIYIQHNLDTDNVAYNMPNGVWISGALDVIKLQNAFKRLIQKHEILRATFYTINDAIVQHINENINFEIDIILDIPENPLQDFVRPFDLEKGPLLRAGLIKYEENRHLLLIDIHHIITDGISQGLLIKDFMAIYNNTEALTTQYLYRDYVEWSLSEHYKKEQEKQKVFWLKEFENKVPILELPTDFKRPLHKAFSGDLIRFEFDKLETQKLQQLAKDQDVTVFMLLMAIYFVLLSKVSNQEDIVIGTPTSGRQHDDLADLLGVFVNTLPVRNTLSGIISFNKFLNILRKKTLQCFDNQAYQYDDLVKALDIKRESARNPLFDVTFSYKNFENQTLNLPDLTISPYEVDHKVSKFDLMLTAGLEEDRIVCELNYSTELFEHRTIARFIDWYKRIANVVLADSQTKISDIAIILDREKDFILNEVNATRAEYPRDASVIEMFEQQANKSPEAIAIEFGEDKVSYRDLNRLSDNLAIDLKGANPAAGDRVGILAGRTFESIVAMIAILKCGGAYVPLDPDYPVSRLESMLSSCQASVVLAHPSFTNRLNQKYDVIPINSDDLDSRNTDDLDKMPTAAVDLAYIMFTSGTTGVPKGVGVTHRNILRLVINSNYTPLDDSIRVMQTGAPSFDAITFEIWGPLLNGGTVCLIDKDKLLNTEELTSTLIFHQVNTMFLTTQLFNQHASVDPSLFGCLKHLMVGGEILNTKLVQLVCEANPDLHFSNIYGPTENTTFSTSCTINADNLEVLPIGKPISNSSAYIVDKYNNLQPIGIPGELLVGGDGLSLGYVNNRELTDKKFIVDPFAQGQKVYKTGDLARWLPDGNIEFIGRIDSQVKIRGFRIELGEVEHQIRSHSKITDAVVEVKIHNSTKHLVGYYVSDKKVSEREIGEYLSSKLPEYMVPAYLMRVPSMPITSNGKVDRSKLPEPSFKTDKYQKPTTPEEKVIAKLWQETLGIKKVGVNDNFFSLGGDSIKSIQICSKIKEAGYNVTVKDIYNFQSVRELAKHMKPRTAFSVEQKAAAKAALTPIQRWFFETTSTDTHHFNQSVLLEFKGGLKGQTVYKVFDHLMEHHDALRTVLIEEKGERMMECLPKERFALKVEEYTIDEDNLLEDIIRDRANCLQSTISISQGPLFRLALFHKQDGCSYLLIIIHHLIVDGLSWRILFQDIEILINQLSSSAKIQLPEQSNSFLEWSHYLQNRLKAKSYIDAVTYWKGLSHADVKSFDRDKLGRNTVGESLRKTFTLDSGYTKKLLSSANIPFKTNANDLLITGLLLAFNRYYGCKAVQVDLESHGRHQESYDLDINRTIGWFTSIYPVVLRYDNGSLDETIRSNKETLRNVPNVGLDYMVMKYLDHSQSLDHIQPSRISFNYLGQFDSDIENKSFSISNLDIGNNISPDANRPYEWDVAGWVVKGQLELGIRYSGEQYHEATIEGFINDLEAVLKELIDYCHNYKGVKLSLADITHKSLSLAELDKLQNKYDLEDVYELSPMQEGMLFHSMYSPQSAHYFEQMTFRLEGELELLQLENSMNELIKRNAILRTAFVAEGLDFPVQVVLREKEIEYSFHDYRKIRGRKAVEEKVKEFLIKDKSEKFDLASGALMRLSLLQLRDQEYELIWDFHHILMDGWSVGKVINEFVQLYLKNINGKKLALARSKPYSKYINWLQSVNRQKSLEYWEQQLKEYNQLATLPQKPDIETSDAPVELQSQTLVLQKKEKEKLDKMCATMGVTANTVLQAAWGLLLMKYNNNNDVVFGSVVSGRPADIEDIDSMIGLFINAIPVRIRSDFSETIPEFVRKVQQISVTGADHHYIPLATVQGAHPLGRKLLNHIFIFENYPVEQSLLANHDLNNTAPFEVKSFQMNEQTNYDLTIIVLPRDEFEIRLDYNVKVYSEGVVKQVLDSLHLILTSFFDEDITELDHVKWISEDYDKRVKTVDSRRKGNDSDSPIEIFHNLQAKPDSNVLISGDKRFSYSDIDKMSDLLALELRHTYKVHAQDLVCLDLHTPDLMLIATLAVWKVSAEFFIIQSDRSYENSQKVFGPEITKVYLRDNMGFLPNDAGFTINLEEFDFHEDTSSEAPKPGSERAPLFYFEDNSGKEFREHTISASSVTGLLSTFKEVLGHKGNSNNSVLFLDTVRSEFEVLCLLSAVFNGYVVLAKQPVEKDKLESKLEIESPEWVVGASSSIYHLLKAENSILNEKQNIIVTDGELLSNFSRKLATEHCYNIFNTLVIKGQAAFIGFVAYKQADEHFTQSFLGSRKAYVLNDQQELMPIGVRGNLYISTNADVKSTKVRGNDEHIFPNPFEPEKLLYKTTIMAAWDESDSIIVFDENEGNNDPLTVEKSLNKHPAVEYSVIKKIEKQGIHKSLAYFKKIEKQPSITEKEEVVINSPVNKVSSLDEADRKDLIKIGTGPKVKVPEDKTFTELLIDQTAKTPDNTAVSCGGLELSYKQLFERSVALSNYLDDYNLSSKARIALYMPRGIDMLVCILAVFQRGSAYVPIDTGYPSVRVNQILEDSEVELVLSTEDLIPNIDEQQLNSLKSCLCIENLQHLENVAPVEQAAINRKPNDISYIIYTSGTTGKPKGVMVHQRGMINHLYAKINSLKVSQNDVIAQTASSCFDISVWQFLSALLVGGKTFIINSDTVMNPLALAHTLKQERITIMQSVPSLLTLFINEMSEQNVHSLGHLRWMVSVGEPLTVSQVQKWYSLYPDIPILNSYGPTEASDAITHDVVDRPKKDQVTISIGRPIQNAKVYILNEHMQLCPYGVTGEICVAGLGVGKGYWKEKQKTERAFIPNPFDSDRNFNTLYRTGDLGYLLPDGNFFCLGRLDHQVKINGNRIELNEIEHHLAESDVIKEAAVVVIESHDKKVLKAFFVSKNDVSGKQIIKFLSSRLPDYMIPHLFQRLGKMPLSTNGKLDRKKLKEYHSTYRGDLKFELQSYLSYFLPGHMIPDLFIETEGTEVEIRELESSPNLLQLEDDHPKTEQEKILLNIWSKVLNIKNVKPTDNFFYIGGDSIKSIQISSRVRSVGYDITVKEIFENPTVRELALKLKKYVEASDQSPVLGESILSPIQDHFFAQHRINDHHYNQSILLGLAKRVSPNLIKTVFKNLLQHHDVLRSIFHTSERPVISEQLDPDSGFSEPEVMLYTDKKKFDTEEKRLVIFNEVQSSLNLSKGPLLKMVMLDMGRSYQLLIVAHHLIMDGFSWRILLEDFNTLIKQSLENSPLSLPAKTDSYKAWAQDLEVYKNSHHYKQSRIFWENYLKAAPQHQLKPDNPKGSRKVKYTQVQSFTLESDLTEKLTTSANSAFNTQITDLLLSAFLLSIKQPKISVELENHGRENVGKVNVSRTIGWFTSIHPVVLERVVGAPLSSVIKNVKETIRSVPNKGMDYLLLRQQLLQDGVGVELIENAQTVFNYLGTIDNNLEAEHFSLLTTPKGHEISPEATRDYEWAVSGIIINKKLTISVSYSEQRFGKSTMQDLVAKFRDNLIHIANYCQDRNLPELTPSDVTFKDVKSEWLAKIQQNQQLEDVYPLSPMQEGMLFHSLMDSEASYYHQQIRYTIRGEVKIASVEAAINHIVKHHAVLRTAFYSEDLDRPLQVVLQNRKADFKFYDFSNHDDSEMVDLVNNILTTDLDKRFDLAHGTLFRLTIVKTAAKAYEFIWSYHHILMDGWCLGMVVRDFMLGYAQHKRVGYLSPLPQAEPYSTYIKWLEEYDTQLSLDFWSDYLEDYEHAVHLPQLDRAKDEQQYTPDVLKVVISKKQTAELKKLSAVHGVTLNNILKTAWGILLAKYNGLDDVVFGAVVSGRPSQIKGVESIIGLFINTIPVRIQLENEESIIDLIKKVQNDALLSENYHHTPLPDIQSLIDSGKEIVDHIFIYENFPLSDQNQALTDTLDFEISNVEVKELNNYNLSVTALPGDEIEVLFEYNAEAFAAHMIRGMANHYHTILDQITIDINQDIRAVEFLTADEVEFFESINSHNLTYCPDQNFLYLLKKQIDNSPNKVAVSHDGQTCTYLDLWRRSNRISNLLTEKLEIGVNDFVLIMMEKSISLIQSILGIWKSGAAYVPIDSNSPDHRLVEIISDLRPAAVITDTSNFERLYTLMNSVEQKVPHLIFGSQSTFDPDYLSECYFEEVLSQHSHELISKNFSNENIAYLIYTSGSTGTPKGVLISHDQYLSAVYSWRKDYNLTKMTVNSLQWASFYFDVFAGDLGRTLPNGGQLVLCSDDKKTDPEYLSELLVEQEVTVFEATPGLMIPLMDWIYQKNVKLEALQLLIVGADTCKADDFNLLQRRFGADIRVVNSYGLTECTIDATIYEYDEDIPLNGPLPIGRPVSNTDVYILNAWGNRLPVGVSGEICIGGPAVGLGYHNNNELTSEKFVSNPLNPHQMIYKTGDVGQWRKDGNIELRGRVDEQIKIRGYRVEIGEIESKLARLEAVDQLTASFMEVDHEKILVAHYKSASYFEESRIRKSAAKLLPDYMLPQAFVRVDNFPLTRNGKINKRSLPKPSSTISSPGISSKPLNQWETKMAQIWSAVLKVDQDDIGCESNFFELGGHSIKAFHLINKIYEVFLEKISLKEIFQNPRLSDVTLLVQSDSKTVEDKIVRLPDREFYDCSPAQVRLFYYQLLYPFTTAFNNVSIVKLAHDAKLDVLKGLFQQLVDHHEILRTSFDLSESGVIQRIHKNVKVNFEVIKVEGHSSLKAAIEHFIRPFDLGQHSMSRCGLFTDSEAGNVLVIDIHHIICDGMSLDLLIRDFKKLSEGVALKLANIRYIDYAEWLKQQKSSQIALQEYWAKQLSGVQTELNLPIKQNRNNVIINEAEQGQLLIEGELYHKFKETIKRAQVSEFMLLITVYYILISKLSGQEDIVIGSDVVGRTNPQLTDVIGTFINLLPLRVTVDHQLPFSELLANVKRCVTEAYDHQDFQYEDMLDLVAKNTDVGTDPLVKLHFAYANFMDTHSEIKDLGFEPVEINASRSTQYEFKLEVAEVPESHLKLDFIYSVDLYDNETMMLFMDYFHFILSSVLEREDILIKDINFIKTASEHM
ncbi:amino acid adenylation domain-containing protein [Fulvivirga sp.]|uniref:amino acid adenylation domain-containing protein n=1 Tax=Fulvivirga sp. TaxID=1931237 RepID=UPI0032EDCF12